MSYIRQSICAWCFLNGGLMTVPQLLRVASDLGYAAIELIDEEYWPLVRDHGLAISAVKGHDSIERGLNRREEHDRIEREILLNLERAAKWNIAHLIVFSGNRDGLDDQHGAEITAEGLRRVAGAAEAQGVTLLLELLNSKVDHPDYQCDHTSWGVEVCRMVDSPRVKLLYDIYHMQIMEGDIIRTIQTHGAYIGHYHTAGNPGRHEIDAHQEIQYPPIMHAIQATGYSGYVGQEFVPTGDPIEALRQAHYLCTV